MLAKPEGFVRVGFYASKSFESVGEALSLPLARSALGSLSEGAVSPNGLTEGVYCVGFYAPKSFESVGEALSLPPAAQPPWLPL